MIRRRTVRKEKSDSLVFEDSTLLGCDGLSEISDVSVDRAVFIFTDQALNTHTKSSQTV